MVGRIEKKSAAAEFCKQKRCAAPTETFTSELPLSGLATGSFRAISVTFVTVAAVVLTPRLGVPTMLDSRLMVTLSRSLGWCASKYVVVIFMPSSCARAAKAWQNCSADRWRNSSMSAALQNPSGLRHHNSGNKAKSAPGAFAPRQYGSPFAKFLIMADWGDLEQCDNQFHSFPLHWRTQCDSIRTLIRGRGRHEITV